MVGLALGRLGGSSSNSGHINNHHSCVPCISYHPVMMVYLAGSNMETVSLVKRTCLSMVRFFSHSLISGVKDWYRSIDFVAITPRVHQVWVVAPAVPFSRHSQAY